MKYLKRIFEGNEWTQPTGQLLLLLDTITQEIKDEYNMNVSYEEGFEYNKYGYSTYIKLGLDDLSNEFNSFKPNDFKIFNSTFYKINEKLTKILEKLESEGYWCNITLDMIGGDTNYTIEFSKSNPRI